MDVAAGCHRYVLGFIEQELGRAVHDVELVICSHDDADHIGGVKQLAELCGAAIAIPMSSNELHHKFLNDPVGILIRFATTIREGFRSRAWNMYLNSDRNAAARKKPKYQRRRDPDLPAGSMKQYRLQGGTALPGFEDWSVIHSPGHSWDSCCYFHEASGSLLSGDTLLGSAKQEKVVTPAIYANSGHTRQSLVALRKLQIQAVYPGHGSVIRGNVAL